MRALVVVFFSVVVFAQNQQNGYYLASDGNYYLANGQDNSITTTTAEPSTTKGPPNRFNEAGWETDDNGNVYVGREEPQSKILQLSGDDNAKLYLISVGSYWPFPKDYRKKREVSEMRIEDMLGFYRL